MAGYSVKGFQTIGPMGTPDGATGSRRLMHSYVTNDVQSVVETANYFLPLYQRLKVGDRIMATVDCGGTPVIRDYVVTVCNATTVTITRGGVVAGRGLFTLSLYTPLIEIPTNADLITNLVLGYNFKIESFLASVVKPATTGAKAATITPKITGVAVTGGVLALTSANCTPAGAQVAASAITALNTGGPTDSISLTSSAVTAFVEGSVYLMLKIRNLDE